VSEATAPAMPPVINMTLFSLTPIPPGEGVESHEIPVTGAQQVAVNVAVTGHGQDLDVEYEIHFIRRAGGADAIAVAQTGTFVQGDHPITKLNTLVPVYAPILRVELNNKGSKRATVLTGWVYGVRLAQGPSVL
jgi:hypothetical protein